MKKTIEVLTKLKEIRNEVESVHAECLLEKASREVALAYLTEASVHMHKAGGSSLLDMEQVFNDLLSCWDMICIDTFRQRE